jgi:IQ and AAA domain-containing protein
MWLIGYIQLYFLQELEFIGMAPKPRDPAQDPRTLDARNAARRKLVQAENRRELERDMEALKTKVEDTEGLDMREVIQDKINAWFVENRHPETGEYPDFPDADEGGYNSQTFSPKRDRHFL